MSHDPLWPFEVDSFMSVPANKRQETGGLSMSLCVPSDSASPINDLRELQAAVGQWSRSNFGEQESKHLVLSIPSPTHNAEPFRYPFPLQSLAPLLGLVEEIGEFARAKNHAEMKDALGDILIYLLDFCSRENTVLSPDSTDWTPNIYTPQISLILTIEVGKLCHAVLKRHEGIRGYDDDRKYFIHRDEAVANLFKIVDTACQALFSESAFQVAKATFDGVVSKRNYKKSPSEADLVVDPNTKSSGAVFSYDEEKAMIGETLSPDTCCNVSGCLVCGNNHPIVMKDVLTFGIQSLSKSFPEAKEARYYYQCPAVQGGYVLLDNLHEPVVGVTP